MFCVSEPGVLLRAIHIKPFQGSDPQAYCSASGYFGLPILNCQARGLCFASISVPDSISFNRISAALSAPAFAIARRDFGLAPSTSDPLPYLQLSSTVYLRLIECHTNKHGVGPTAVAFPYITSIFRHDLIVNGREKGCCFLAGASQTYSGL